MKVSKIFFRKIIFMLSFIFLVVTSSIHSQIKVELPNIKCEVNSEIHGIIKIGLVTDYNVVAFQFAAYYDKDIISITGVDVNECLITGNMPVFNADTLHGKIVVAWASASPIIGEGALLKLKIKTLKNGVSKLTTIGPNGETFMLNAGNPNSAVKEGEIIVGEEEGKR